MWLASGVLTDDPNFRQRAVMITDGKPSAGQDACSQVYLYQQAGLELYVVAIGDETFWNLQCFLNYGVTVVTFHFNIASRPLFHASFNSSYISYRANQRYRYIWALPAMINGKAEQSQCMGAARIPFAKSQGEDIVEDPCSMTNSWG